MKCLPVLKELDDEAFLFIKDNYSSSFLRSKDVKVYGN